MTELQMRGMEFLGRVFPKLLQAKRRVLYIVVKILQNILPNGKKSVEYIIC